MTMQTTLALIKPDAMVAGHFIPILRIMSEHFLIGDVSVTRWGAELAKEFYVEHSHRDFFKDLVEFTASAPIAAVTLAGVDAVTRWRELIGPTNPAEARRSRPESLRARFGGTDLVMHNAVHGSDSLESAAREINIIASGLAEYDALSFGRLGREIAEHPHRLGRRRV